MQPTPNTHGLPQRSIANTNVDSRVADLLSLVTNCARSEQYSIFQYNLHNAIQDVPAVKLEEFLAVLNDNSVRSGVNSLASRFTDSDDSINPEQLHTSIVFAVKLQVAYNLANAAKTKLRTAILLRNSSELSAAIELGINTITNLATEYTITDNRTDAIINSETKISDIGYVNIFIKTPQAHTESSFSAFSDLAELIIAGEWHRKVINDLTPASHDQIARDRLQYGAKASNLLAIERGKTQLTSILNEVGVSFNLPSFALLPAIAPEGSYSKEQLRSTYEWINKRSVMVRSSAVHSEDGEHLGAGIYKSVLLPKNASFEMFCLAISKITQSTNSARAVSYRAACNIQEQELMGIIIQEYVSETYSDPAGHINTVRPQLPQIIDVVVESRHVPEFNGADEETVDGNLLLQSLHREELECNPKSINYAHALVTKFDARNSHRINPHYLPELGVVGLVLERYFERPLQIEFVSLSGEINIVQARPLPTSWITPSTIKFPENKEWLWQGESLGVIDETLDVLDNNTDNNARTGVVILSSEHMGSTVSGWLDSVLPKHGAVILLRPSSLLGGHIQSLCASRGIVVLTGEMISGDDENRSVYLSRLWQQYGSNPENRLFANGMEPQILPPSESMQKLRIVSTGLSARIYPA